MKDPLVDLLSKSGSSPDDDGKTTAQLAAELGVCTVTVQRRLKALIAAGVVRSRNVNRMGLKPYPIAHVVYSLVAPPAPSTVEGSSIPPSSRRRS